MCTSETLVVWGKLSVHFHAYSLLYNDIVHVITISIVKTGIFQLLTFLCKCVIMMIFHVIINMYYEQKSIKIGVFLAIELGIYSSLTVVKDEKYVILLQFKSLNSFSYKILASILSLFFVTEVIHYNFLINFAHKISLLLL